MSSEMEKGEGRREVQSSDAQAVSGTSRTSARRGFLLGAGAAAGVAGAAALVLKAPQSATQEVVEPVVQQEPEKGRGYHVTAHVRKYYDTTKV